MCITLCYKDSLHQHIYKDLYYPRRIGAKQVLYTFAFMYKCDILTSKKQLFPEPTVGALIFNKAGRLLLVKSHKWRGRYVVPGGHIELGERMVDALKREIREETGLEIYGIEFIGIQEFVFGRDFWKKRHYLFLDFSCRAKSSKVTLNSESEEYRWMTIREALSANVEPYTKRAIINYTTLQRSRKKA